MTRSCGPRQTPEPTGTGSLRAPGPATKGLRARGATAVAWSTGLRGIGAGSRLTCGCPEIRCGQGGENTHGKSRRLEGSPRGALPSRVDGIRQARRSSCGPWPGPVGRPNPARSSQVALSAVKCADNCRRDGREGGRSRLLCRGQRPVSGSRPWILFPFQATTHHLKTTVLQFTIGFPYRVCYLSPRGKDASERVGRKGFQGGPFFWKGSHISLGHPLKLIGPSIKRPPQPETPSGRGPGGLRDSPLNESRTARWSRRHTGPLRGLTPSLRGPGGAPAQKTRGR